VASITGFLTNGPNSTDFKNVSQQCLAAKYRLLNVLQINRPCVGDECQTLCNENITISQGCDFNTTDSTAPIGSQNTTDTTEVTNTTTPDNTTASENNTNITEIINTTNTTNTSSPTDGGRRMLLQMIQNIVGGDWILDDLNV